jgi:hypothetical protein
MATITTRGEQVRMARLKDSVGGYTEMERLLKEQRAVGPNAQLRRGPDGRLTYLPDEAPPRRVANGR